MGGLEQVHFFLQKSKSKQNREFFPLFSGVFFISFWGGGEGGWAEAVGVGG